MFDRWMLFSIERKAILTFTFFVLVVLSRNVLETLFFASKIFIGYYVVLHHFNWYLYVFFYYLIVVRYILKMKKSSLVYLPLGGAVVYIPVIYSFLFDSGLKLEYIQGRSFFEIFYQIATLMYFHPQNHPFFVEMIVIMALFVVVSYAISRSVVRTLLNLFLGFYGSILVAGVHLFGVYPYTRALVKVHTIFTSHQLMSLIYFMLGSIAMALALYPEIKVVLKRVGGGKRYLKALLVGAILYELLLPALFSFYYEKPLTVPDGILLLAPYCLIFSTCYFSFSKALKREGWLFSVFYLLNGSMILFPLFFAFYNVR